jgi:hypothetical protein
LIPITINQGTNSGKSNISYIKRGLFSKFEFTKYRKITYCLYRNLVGTRKIFYVTSLNTKALNYDLAVNGTKV